MNVGMSWKNPKDYGLAICAAYQSDITTRPIPPPIKSAGEIYFLVPQPRADSYVLFVERKFSY